MITIIVKEVEIKECGMISTPNDRWSHDSSTYLSPLSQPFSY